MSPSHQARTRGGKGVVMIPSWCAASVVEVQMPGLWSKTMERLFKKDCDGDQRETKIRDALVSELKARFPDIPSSVVDGATWEMRIPAPNPHIGFVSVSADEEEATVFVGEITHGHFNPYDSSLSEDAHAKWVSDAVIGFLEDLFRDRVVVWTSASGGRGGWFVLEEGAEPELSKNVSAHLWSRPLSQTQ